jgi:GntR family transcriptional regulator/MocR family aminotransferase
MEEFMLTYDLKNEGKALYIQLYECIKQDITEGTLPANEKLPSKRTLAKNLGVSTITVENAYDQLMGEGYVYAITKRGYYVSDISDHGGFLSKKATVKLDIKAPRTLPDEIYDFSANHTDPDNFPFSVWAKMVRETLSANRDDLLKGSSCGGVRPLREAIANHLSSFRGMVVDPDQIVVGAGTEYLYSLLIKLLGQDKIYCVENPGYKKIVQIYESNHVECRFVNMDENGVDTASLSTTGADIAHISPTHHFPTGITMPISRRYELLAWANEKPGRYIIEDEYDSEFRLNGKPVPTLQSIDGTEKVIYMNTFSKSLASTIRISYMVLPAHLANEFYERLSFYACTVSTFDQYALAAFISRGYLEKHINRMRLYYIKKRRFVMNEIQRIFDEDECSIIENDSGLHFLLKLSTDIPDETLEQKLLAENIRLQPLSSFYHTNHNSGDTASAHMFIVNYSNIDASGLDEALSIIKKEIFRYL